MKKFLAPFAAIASTFVAQHSQASVPAVVQNTPVLDTHVAKAEVGADGQLVVKTIAGDKFDFLLKRTGDKGILEAYHYSHSSHASHSSHSSHFSSRY